MSVASCTYPRLRGTAALAVVRGWEHMVAVHGHNGKLYSGRGP
jgi:hypothetical protein